MSGNYNTENQDAPGGLADTAAQVAAGVQSAAAKADQRQQEAGRFFVENGESVVGGHAEVGTSY